MAGRRELGFPKTSIGNLKEQLVRTTLRNVRSQGHPYVELREDGKKLIFFCTLCLAPCYGDSNLFDHLKGNLHTQRLATAQITLLKPNPWPFNDGVFFFHDTEEKNKTLPVSGSEQNKLLEIDQADVNSLALVSYGENLGPNGSTQHTSQEIQDNACCDENPCDSIVDGNGAGRQLVIPAVLQKDEVSDLVVRHIGVGKIGARFIEKDEVSKEIRRIWCEWLGDEDFNNEDIDMASEHDFAVVTFSYNYNLGRRGLLDDFRYLLPSSPHSEAEDSGCSRGKKRKSFSDPEDISEALSNQDDPSGCSRGKKRKSFSDPGDISEALSNQDDPSGCSRGKKRKSFSDPECISKALNNQDDSSGEESQSSNSSKSKTMFSGNDDQQVFSRILSSKAMRKQLRNQQRVASERSCDICQQRMLPNKDVAALLNRRTGKLVCSSRNSTGAFHLFHISCLIQWMLLCEVELYAKLSVEPKVKPKPRFRRKVKRKNGQNGAKHEILEKPIHSAFCPECQGTGIRIDGDDLEKPTVPLSEIFRLKIKLCDARKAWIKNPELLQNCSLGFDFPLQSGEMYQENVAPLKLLHFYHAND